MSGIKSRRVTQPTGSQCPAARPSALLLAGNRSWLLFCRQSLFSPQGLCICPLAWKVLSLALGPTGSFSLFQSQPTCQVPREALPISPPRAPSPFPQHCPHQASSMSFFKAFLPHGVCSVYLPLSVTSHKKAGFTLEGLCLPRAHMLRGTRPTLRDRHSGTGVESPSSARHWARCCGRGQPALACGAPSPAGAGC